MLRAWEQASSDQSELDWEVYHKFNGFAVTTIQLVGTIIVMSQVGWEILLLFAPVFVACIFMQVWEPSSSNIYLFLLAQFRAYLSHFFLFCKFLKSLMQCQWAILSTWASNLNFSSRVHILKSPLAPLAFLEFAKREARSSFASTAYGDSEFNFAIQKISVVACASTLHSAKGALSFS